jgi:AsmA protein
MDISKKERSYKLQYAVTGASLEFFVEKFYKKKFLKGTIDYSVDLHAIGESWTVLKKNMAGEIKISGDSIHLSGIVVDKVIQKFERSQNFNLTDIGAVLIAGPVGLAVTKGSDFVSLATVNLKPNHHTLIKELNTTWTLQDRQLITKDVAFATFQNRIAFNGRIDFARDSIPGLTIAVIDKNGCSLMDQKLYGKTNNLKTGKLNITKTLFGSVINFMNVIVGKDCKPVYTGKVEAPVK